MQITTLHTLTFSMRAANGKYALAESIITAAVETMSTETSKVMVTEIKALPLTPEDDAGSRGSQVSVSCTDADKLELFWTNLSDALALIGVDATSP